MSGDSKNQPNIFYTKTAPILLAECLLSEGKVKSLYRLAEEPEKVYIHFHDKVTAGNGKRLEFPKDKGKTCCLISALLFELMEKKGVKTHYLSTEGLDTMLCRKLTIVPVEVIVRNIAAGSIVKNTTLTEGTLLQPPLVEYFLKVDAKDDPLLTLDRVGLMGIDPEPMRDAALKINNHFQILFAQLDNYLDDLKMEFGYDFNGNLCLADELSPDNMRLWKKGTKEKFDKDLFRKDEGDIVTAYTYILEELRKFI